MEDEDKSRLKIQPGISAEEPRGKKAVSDRKVEANRRNAQKSTGPITARGKRNSSANARKHGMTARLAMYSANGDISDPAIEALRAELIAQYGDDDIGTAIIIELVLGDLWRHRQALTVERESAGKVASYLPTYGAMPNLARYSIASRNSLRQGLSELDKRRRAAEESSYQPATDESATEISQDASGELASGDGDSDCVAGADARASSEPVPIVAAPLAADTGDSAAAGASLGDADRMQCAP